MLTNHRTLSSIIDDAVNAKFWKHGEEHTVFAFPIVVVPDGRFWIQDYDKAGTRSSLPEQASVSDIFIGHLHSTRSNIGQLEFCTSHMKIVTISELNNVAIKLRDGALDLIHRGI